jgi:ubiquitin carboxyl-terminal hydrolase 8
MNTSKYNNKGLSGLLNIGNTCWLNSATQLLSNALPLTTYFLENKYKEDINISNKEFKFLREWIKLLQGMWSENCTIKPISYHRTFYNFYNGGLYDQEDSEEGLSKILDLLHESVSYEVDIKYNGKPKNKTDRLMIESIKSWQKSFKKTYSKIVELFYGQYLSEIKCLNCGYCSYTFDPFSIIQLAINHKDDNLDDCLNNFVKIEKLDDDCNWKCDKCNICNKSEKKLLLWKSPKVLIIQLKRFDFTRDRKIKNNIDFPLENLDINKYIGGYNKSESIYNLCGIIEHMGNTNEGHYISHNLNSNGNWYTYNDENVYEISKSDVTNRQAYILAYIKKN